MSGKFQFKRFALAGLIFTLLNVGPLRTHADPITREEAADWIALVRSINHWGPEVDLTVEAQERARIAGLALAKNATSRSAFRDLGDAYHTLGHMAEHEHNFSQAIMLHLRANQLFENSGLRTRESWSDGRDHALEHVFMNLYDIGVVTERAGQTELAYRYFDTAMFFVSSYRLNERVGSERFNPRYESLIRYFQKAATRDGVKQIVVGKHAESIMAGVRCASAFESVYQ